MVLRIPPVIKIKANNNNNNGNGKGGVKVQEIPNPTKIVYKLYVVNVITGTNQDSNNNKHLYLASNLFKPHLNKEVCLARHYHNSHSSFSKHNLNNNNQYFSFKIDKK